MRSFFLLITILLPFICMAQGGLTLKMDTRPEGSLPRAFGRFEADAVNDLWIGDALHGPVVAGAKTYLLAFIDDHSRALVGYRWAHAEDTLALAAALRAGLAARGIPKVVYLDNGSAMVSKQLLRALAVAGWSYQREKIMPGVETLGITLGGQTVESAARQLENDWNARRVALRTEDDSSITLPLVSLGLILDADERPDVAARYASSVPAMVPLTLATAFCTPLPR